MQLADRILNAHALKRGRPPLLFLGLVVSLSAAFIVADVARAAGRPAPPVIAGSRYLALGDSVTFGYEEPQVVPAPAYLAPSSLIGYPELLASELHLKVTNAACPGETTASMINGAAQSNNCENSLGHPTVGYRRSFPLHTSYSGSQLAFALSYLRSHRNVRLVSLMIGANDGLICIETTGCSTPAELNALLATVTKNVHRILRAIRHDAHYSGQLVFLNYFSPFPAYNPLVIKLNKALDAAGRPFHVIVADGYGAFQTADRRSGGDPCVAGLMTQLGSPGQCGIHPSYAGQALLAYAVEKVIRL